MFVIMSKYLLVIAAERIKKKRKSQTQDNGRLQYTSAMYLNLFGDQVFNSQHLAQQQLSDTHYSITNSYAN